MTPSLLAALLVVARHAVVGRHAVVDRLTATAQLTAVAQLTVVQGANRPTVDARVRMIGRRSGFRNSADSMENQKIQSGGLAWSK